MMNLAAIARIKQHIYDYDKIVVGGNLHAIQYAFLNGLPLIINNPNPPHRFEFFKNGKSKLEKWEQLVFILSLAGKNLFPREVFSIRIKDSQLTAYTQNSTAIKIKFNKLILFDDEKIEGLPSPTKKQNIKMVLDWMKIKSCSPHVHKHVKKQDNFINEIFFYPSKIHPGKNLVTISYLTQEQINHYEYSDAYARFKVFKILKDLGLKGSRNGRSVLDPSKYTHYALKLEAVKREIKKQNMHLYPSTKNIEFRYNIEGKVPNNNLYSCKVKQYLNV